MKTTGNSRMCRYLSRTPSTDPNFYQKNGATYNATEYDAHYLAGNYYQWNAATAGTGGAITSGNAAGSICPKNWKLPSSAISTSTIIKGTYAYLLRQYGLASTWDSGSLSGTSSVNGATYNIAQSPLFFVRSGSIWYGDPTPFNGASLTSAYWSSRAGSSTGVAYGVYFDERSTYPSNGRFVYSGYPIRCLVQTP